MTQTKQALRKALDCVELRLTFYEEEIEQLLEATAPIESAAGWKSDHDPASIMFSFGPYTVTFGDLWKIRMAAALARRTLAALEPLEEAVTVETTVTYDGIKLSERARNYLIEQHGADETSIQAAIENMIESRATVYGLASAQCECGHPMSRHDPSTAMLRGLGCFMCACEVTYLKGKA